jgi:hypothetical protein
MSSVATTSPGCWPLFLTLLSTETNVTVLSHSYALLLVCAGTFRSGDALREYLAAAAPSKRENANSSSSTSNSQVHSLWRSQWSWNASIEGARPACERDITTLLHPLVLSVHPKQRSMSSMLLKAGSTRAAATLQQLWTNGVEFVLAMLHGASSAFRTAVLSASLSDFTFTRAFQAYVSSTLAHLPFVASSSHALWRMLELIFELFLGKDETAETEEQMKEDTTMWMLLETCFEELSTAAAVADFDPYLCGASSPYLSLTSLLLRFVKLLLDDASSARAKEGARLWEALPALQVMCFQVLVFDSTREAGAERARSQLVQDAEYILTRRYFDGKHISKILPLICIGDSSTTASSPFVPQIALYLPPACEQLLKAQKDSPFQYKREGLNSSLRMVFPGDTSSISLISLLPSAYTHHFFTVILNLLKKYLLFASSDAVAGASNTLSAVVATGSTVRAVRDMQQEKTSIAILSTLARVLVDHTSHFDTANGRSAEIIQTTLLEFYLWNVRRSMRVKEVFDLARRGREAAAPGAASYVAAAKVSGVDVLFGLGVRVLLCLVDAITTCMHGSGLHDAPAASSTSGHSPRAVGTASSSIAVSSFTAVWTENIENLIQDVAQILTEWRAEAHVAASASDSAPPLQIGDVFDLTYQTSQLVPPRVHRVAELYTIVQQVHAFFVSVAPRFAPLTTSSLSAAAAHPLFHPTPPSSSSSTHSLISPTPPALSSPSHRRPFSSYSRVEGGASASAASRSGAPRAPSYSPPSSSNSGGLGGLNAQGGGLQGVLLSPRSIRSVAAAQLASSEAGSLTARTPRRIKLLPSTLDPPLQPLAPSLPRSSPASSHAAARDTGAPHLKPLSGGELGKVSKPMEVGNSKARSSSSQVTK